MTAAERRAHPRMRLALGAEVQTDSATFTATTRDVSPSGCCLESTHPLEEGSEVALCLYVVVDGIEDQASPRVAARARVRWTVERDQGPTRYISGVELTDLAEAHKSYLAAVMARSIPT